MRGSVYYQTSLLVKAIFIEGAKKIDRVNKEHSHYLCVASFKTMESYRRIWNNFFFYLKEHFHLKNCERIESLHIKAYIDYKIEYIPSKQYLEKIVSALGKLEVALNRYSKERYKENAILYDFKIRESILKEARDLKLVANNYHSRFYYKPLEIISKIKEYKHYLAALIQLQGGARVEGVLRIQKEQLKGIQRDAITNKEVGVITTKEKGGKVGDVYLEVSTYTLLEDYILGIKRDWEEGDWKEEGRDKEKARDKEKIKTKEKTQEKEKEVKQDKRENEIENKSEINPIHKEEESLLKENDEKRDSKIQENKALDLTQHSQEYKNTDSTFKQGANEANTQISIKENIKRDTKENKAFSISYQSYLNDLKQACILSNQPYHGSHGLRWTFARNRVITYQMHGYNYHQALQGVSYEMKHFRASITEHYLG